MLCFQKILSEGSEQEAGLTAFEKWYQQYKVITIGGENKSGFSFF